MFGLKKEAHILPSATTRINLEYTVITSQTHKDKHYMSDLLKAPKVVKLTKTWGRLTVARGWEWGTQGGVSQREPSFGVWDA